MYIHRCIPMNTPFLLNKMHRRVAVFTNSSETAPLAKALQGTQITRKSPSSSRHNNREVPTEKTTNQGEDGRFPDFF